MPRNQPFRFTVPPQLLEDAGDRALHCGLYALDAAARRTAVIQAIIAAVRDSAPRVEDDQSLQLRLDDAERAFVRAEQRRQLALPRAAVHWPVVIAAAAVAVVVPAWVWLPRPMFAAVIAVCAVGAVAVLRHHLVAAWASLAMLHASRARRRLRGRQALARQIGIETDRAVRLVAASFDAAYEEVRSAVTPLHAAGDAAAEAEPDAGILPITRNTAQRMRASEPRSVT